MNESYPTYGWVIPHMWTCRFTAYDRVVSCYTPRHTSMNHSNKASRHMCIYIQTYLHVYRHICIHSFKLYVRGLYDNRTTHKHVHDTQTCTRHTNMYTQTWTKTRTRTHTYNHCHKYTHTISQKITPGTFINVFLRKILELIIAGGDQQLAIPLCVDVCTTKT